jgi:hypothetical protein
VQRADQLPEGVGAPVRLQGDEGWTVVVVYGRARVQCALCNREQRLARLASASEEALRCDYCGALSAKREAPSWLRLPGAERTLLIGEALGGFLREPLPWYLVRLHPTQTDHPPLLPEATDPAVLSPPAVRNALSLVLTHAPHEVEATMYGGTEELDLDDLEADDDALESADTGQLYAGV